MNSETFPLARRIPVKPADEDLARQALDGDLEAFNSLIDRHSHALYYVVRRLCSDRAEAEAITQEAFLRAWSRLGQWQPERPFWPWLVQIGVNAARDALRKSRPLDFTDLPVDPAESLADEDPGPEALLERADALAALNAAVERLPQAYRLVLALRFQAGMTYDDMAAALAMPVNTVRTHLRRAKKHLRRMLEADDVRSP